MFSRYYASCFAIRLFYGRLFTAMRFSRSHAAAAAAITLIFSLRCRIRRVFKDVIRAADYIRYAVEYFRRLPPAIRQLRYVTAQRATRRAYCRRDAGLLSPFADTLCCRRCLRSDAMPLMRLYFRRASPADADACVTFMLLRLWRFFSPAAS